MDQSPDLMRFYRDWITDVPDELTTAVIHLLAAGTPTIPAELHGRPVVAVVACYAGPVEDGEKAVAPLQGLCARRSWTRSSRSRIWSLQSMLDPSFPHGRWYYMRGV